MPEEVTPTVTPTETQEPAAVPASPDAASPPGKPAAGAAVSPPESAAPPPAKPTDETPLTGARKAAVDVLADAFEGVEELATDKWYDELKPEQVKDLPTVARRFLHNVRLDYQKKVAALEAKQTDAVKTIMDREAAIKRAETDLLRRQAEFAATFNRPEVQAVLKPPEGEVPDPLSPDGQKALIARQVQEQFATQYAPMAKAAQEIQQRARYAELVERHPEMNNEAFKGDVHKLWKGRQGTPAALTVEDAILLIKATRATAADAERRAREQAVRAESARQVQRATAGSSGEQGTIPKGLKGAALYEYLANNPQAHASVRRNLGR